MSKAKQNDRLDPVIEQYFRDQSGNVTKHSELFKGNDDFIDQMTELTADEIRLLLSLDQNDKFLKGMGIGEVFGSYAHKFMRLMVSKDRKSRGEYVEVNKQDSMSKEIKENILNRN